MNKPKFLLIISEEGTIIAITKDDKFTCANIIQACKEFYAMDEVSDSEITCTPFINDYSGSTDLFYHLVVNSVHDNSYYNVTTREVLLYHTMTS